MTSMFFLKIFKILCRFHKYKKKKKKKNQKKVLVLKIIAFESRNTNSHIPEQDTCHWQSTCYKTHLRFNISLREIFFKSDSLRVMKKYDQSSNMQILQQFGTL